MSEQPKLRVIKPSTSEYQTISSDIVAKALPRQKEYFIRDNQLKDFYVRMKPSGTKTYGIQARKNRTGTPVSRAIGSTSRYSCKEARTLAREWLQEISQGIDPKESRKDLYRERFRRLLVTLRRPRALTTSNSDYYSRRNNFLKRFNKVEEPYLL